MAALAQRLLEAGRCAKHLVLLAGLGMCATARAQTTPDVVWQSTATNRYVLNPVAVSPDGGMAATLGTNQTIQVWRMRDGAPVVALPGHGLWVGELAFAPDGAYLASGGGDRSVRVWRTADWSPAYSVATVNQGPPVAFAPDSATLAVGNGTAIELRRTTNGALVRSWTGTSGWELTALAFSPDGTQLASGAGQRGADTALSLWEVSSGALLRRVPTAQTYSVLRAVFSPDGQQVLTSGSAPMQSWRVSDGTLLRTYPEPAYGMAFSADGTVLGAAGTNLTMYRASDGVRIAEYTDGFAGYSAGPKGIAFAPADGLFVRSRGLGEVMAGRVPVLVSVARGEGGQLLIGWVGGTGRYQLQRALDLGGGWQEEGGVLTTRSVLLPSGASAAFYRVSALPP